MFKIINRQHTLQTGKSSVNATFLKKKLTHCLERETIESGISKSSLLFFIHLFINALLRALPNYVLGFLRVFNAAE